VYAVGVDLGTVYTGAATSREGRAEVFPLGGRSAVIPSVVLVREDGAVLVGDPAVRRALLEPSRVAREFKRRFGDSTPIMVGGFPYLPEALTGRLLEAVVSQVSAEMGESPQAVCVCHPATWGSHRTGLLQQAVVDAGLEMPVTFAVEPVAAATYYAQQERVPDGSLVGVYDLGGGTFDAAVVRVGGDGAFEVVGRPEGIDHLGGADFDAAVFAHVRSVVGPSLDALEESSSAAIAAVAQLRTECTAAKEVLSSDTDTTIPVLLPGAVTEVRLTRAEFERMIRPSLHDTVTALRRAVASAGVTPEDLHSVLLIGGSSRIPLVAQLVTAELGRPVAVDAHPKHAVALGAALIAAARAATVPVPEPDLSEPDLSQSDRASAITVPLPAVGFPGPTAPVPGPPGPPGPVRMPPPVLAPAVTVPLPAVPLPAAPAVPRPAPAVPSAAGRAAPRPAPAARSWRRVLLAATAVVLVAAGAAVALRSWGTASTATGPRAMSSSTSPAAPPPNTVPVAFAGTWSGVLHQPPDAATGTDTTITMAAGASTASYTLPRLGCQAVLTVTAASAGASTVEASEQLTVDPAHRCAARAHLTLTLNADRHEITVQWQSAADPNDIARGVLTRQ